MLLFGLGLLFGYLRYRSHSIWLTVILHGLNNLVQNAVQFARHEVSIATVHQSGPQRLWDTLDDLRRLFPQAVWSIELTMEQDRFVMIAHAR